MDQETIASQKETWMLSRTIIKQQKIGQVIFWSMSCPNQNSSSWTNNMTIMTNGILNVVVPLGWYYGVCMETLGGCRTEKGWRYEGQNEQAPNNAIWKMKCKWIEKSYKLGSSFLANNGD